MTHTAQATLQEGMEVETQAMILTRLAPSKHPVVLEEAPMTPMDQETPATHQAASEEVTPMNTLLVPPRPQEAMEEPPMIHMAAPAQLEATLAGTEAAMTTPTPQETPATHQEVMEEATTTPIHTARATLQATRARAVIALLAN